MFKRNAGSLGLIYICIHSIVHIRIIRYINDYNVNSDDNVNNDDNDK